MAAENLQLERRILALTREIRDFYGRSCALADLYNAGLDAERRALTDAFRAPQSSINELNYFEDILDRNDAVKKALADRSVRRQTTWFQAAFCVLVFGVIWECLLRSPGNLFGPVALTLVLGVAATLVCQRYVMGSEPFRRHLRGQLVARGVPICVPCGYDLRGQIEPRCPECGHAAAAGTKH